MYSRNQQSPVGTKLPVFPGIHASGERLHSDWLSVFCRFSGKPLEFSLNMASGNSNPDSSVTCIVIAIPRRHVEAELKWKKGQVRIFLFFILPKSNAKCAEKKLCSGHGEVPLVGLQSCDWLKTRQASDWLQKVPC